MGFRASKTLPVTVSLYLQLMQISRDRTQSFYLLRSQRQLLKKKKVRTSLKTTVNCTIQKGMSSTVYSAKTKDSEKLKILNPVTELNILQRVSIQLLRRKLS